MIHVTALRPPNYYHESNGGALLLNSVNNILGLLHNNVRVEGNGLIHLVLQCASNAITNRLACKYN